MSLGKSILKKLEKAYHIKKKYSWNTYPIAPTIEQTTQLIELFPETTIVCTFCGNSEDKQKLLLILQNEEKVIKEDNRDMTVTVALKKNALLCILPEIYSYINKDGDDLFLQIYSLDDTLKLFCQQAEIDQMTPYLSVHINLYEAVMNIDIDNEKYDKDYLRAQIHSIINSC